jgi:2-polyprenyl-6-methoxyphenol hydroxylase-like FAD-dependent oxidoreductase
VTDFDVVVLGGGLSGLTLAMQLTRRQPDIRVAVVEKSRFPVPDAAHKVGESTVEIGALYFADTLGLRSFLESWAVPKMGLRFHFSDGDNRDIGKRSEFGLSEFMPVSTWQISRGGIENELFRRLEGKVELLDGSKVAEVTLGEPHRVVVRTPDGERTLSTRWVVDATGRTAFLKKRLGLARRTRHQANAVWWRVPDAVDVDAWSSQPGWLAGPVGQRWLSTIHLLGDSYWVWLIPLPGGGTSVGIVGDDRRHPIQTLRSREAADDWLRTFEPQCAEVLADGGDREDHLALKHYCHSATQVYSKDRWALVGDAGVFLDPFYSPGSDFIGLGNGFVTDLVQADLAGAPDFEDRCELWNGRMLSMFRAYLATWQGRYPLMGRPEVMRAKILWDFSFYWSSHALMFTRGLAADAPVVRRTDGLFREFLALNLDMQALLTRWGKVAPEHDDGRVVVDYHQPAWLRQLNDALQRPGGDIADDMAANRDQMRRVASELQARALRREPGLERMAAELPVSDGSLTAFLG